MTFRKMSATDRFGLRAVIMVVLDLPIVVVYPWLATKWFGVPGPLEAGADQERRRR